MSAPVCAVWQARYVGFTSPLNSSVLDRSGSGMSFWKRKKNQAPEVEAVFHKMRAATFPGGDEQIALETAEVASILDGSVSRESARDILVHAKVRALIATQSTRDSEEAVQRCIDSVHAHSQGRLNRAMAEKVAVFAFQRLIEQQHKKPSEVRAVTWMEMTKEEALEVSRLTAYTLARHQGRADTHPRQLYDVDPVMYITAAMEHFLTGGKGTLPTKIETAQDAVELALNVTRILILAYYVEKHGAAYTPDPQETDRLAKKELERTLDLVRNKEAVNRYSGYDPSEARAAYEMQVPFNVALALGEVGLLKDPPGPTDARRKILKDVLSRLRDG